MGKVKARLEPEVEAKLVKTLKDRDAAAVEKLVATGINVNVSLKSEQDESPLSVATRYGANDVAVVLFKAGADWREGGLNLMWSVYFRDEWLTRKLIEVGADPNYNARVMGRPLPLATKYNLPKLMRLLIDAGADVNADSALAEAVAANYSEAALILLNAGAKVAGVEKLLPWAARHGNRELLVALIKAGADLNEKATLSEYNSKKSKHVGLCEHATPLIIAAGNGAEELVQDLIEAGADLYATDAKGATALEVAQQNKHAKVVTLLQAASAKKPRQADPSAELIFAAEKGDAALVKKLLAAGANPNVRDTRPKSQAFTPLMLAARAGHREAVAALLDGGADVILKDDGNLGEDMGFGFIYNEAGIEGVLEAGYSMARTALHWAAEKGQIETSRLLIARGGEIDVPDRAKMTPLHLAADADAAEIVGDLLKAGADKDARARSKLTPLHYACRRGNVEVVRALLAAGAKVDLKNDDGNTPLIVAAGRARPLVVQALLDAGADIHTVNRDGESAINKAAGSGLYEHKYKGKQVVVNFLRPEAEILETIRVLMAAGADPTVKDKRGSSALDQATRSLKASKFYAGVIELLKAAQSRAVSSPAVVKVSKAKAAKEAAKPALATKRVKSADPAPKPDFSTAVKSATFQTALGELEKLCGTKCQPSTEFKGGFTLHVESGKNFDLDAVHRDFLNKGAYVFSPDSNFERSVGVLPTADKYDVLLAMQTNGQNYDLMPQDVVEWLRTLERDQPFTITSAGFDFLGGKFLSKIAKPAELAKRMYEFCPDIVDQGAGDVKALAAELRKSGTLYFWWD